jgi:hypothetical protein
MDLVERIAESNRIESIEHPPTRDERIRGQLYRTTWRPAYPSRVECPAGSLQRRRSKRLGSTRSVRKHSPLHGREWPIRSGVMVLEAATLWP